MQPNLLLIECVNTNRFDRSRSDFFPFIQGLMKAQSWDCTWLRIGLDYATFQQKYQMEFLPKDFSNLLNYLDTHSFTHILFNEKILDTHEKTLREKYPDLSIAHLYLHQSNPDIYPALLHNDMTPLLEWLIPGYVKQTYPKGVPSFLDTFLPEYYTIPFNSLAETIRPIVPILCGPICYYQKSLTENPKYASLDKEVLRQHHGCAFCENMHPTYFYETPPLALAMRQLNQVCKTDNHHQDSWEFFIMGFPVFKEIKSFFEALTDMQFPSAHFYFSCRVDEFLRKYNDIETMLPLCQNHGYHIHLWNMGVENFSPDENQRLNKGLSIDTFYKAVPKLHQLEQHFPDHFHFNAMGGFGFILFTPWTRIQDIRINLDALDALEELGLTHQAFILRTKLQLIPNRAITLLAEQDGLTAETFMDYSYDSGCIVDWNIKEVPWRFKYPEMESIYQVFRRISSNEPIIMQDPLYKQLQHVLKKIPGGARSWFKVARQVLDIVESSQTVLQAYEIIQALDKTLQTRDVQVDTSQPIREDDLETKFRAGSLRKAIEIMVSDSCNQACRKCHYIENYNTEKTYTEKTYTEKTYTEKTYTEKNHSYLLLEKDAIIQYIESTAQKYPNLELVFSGKEATMNEALPRFIYTAKKNNVHRIVLKTNGLLCASPKYVLKLKHAGLDAAIITLFSCEEEAYDSWTQQPGSYSLVFRALQNLTDQRIDSMIHIVVYPGMYEYLLHWVQTLHANFPAIRWFRLTLFLTDTHVFDTNFFDTYITDEPITNTIDGTISDYSISDYSISDYNSIEAMLEAVKKTISWCEHTRIPIYIDGNAGSPSCWMPELATHFQPDGSYETYPVPCKQKELFTSSDRVVLLECINKDQFPGQIHAELPFIKGYLNYRGIPNHCIRFGMDASNLYAHGRDAVTFNETEFNYLKQQISAIQPTGFITTHPLYKNQLDTLHSLVPSMKTRLIKDVVLDLGMQDTGIPGLLDLQNFSPDYSWEPGNHHALSNQTRNIYLVLAQKCGYHKPVSSNSWYASWVEPSNKYHRGCSFCGYRNQPHETEIARITPSHWITKQIKAIAASSVHNDSVQPPYSLLLPTVETNDTLQMVIQAMQNTGLAAHTQLMLSIRTDQLVRQKPILYEYCKQDAVNTPTLYIFSCGLENFSLEELNRFNKGTTPAINYEAIQIMQDLENTYPKQFNYSQYNGLSIILFTPWTQPEEVWLNLSIIWLLGLEKSIGNLFISRLRLHPDLPITQLAKQAGAIADQEPDDLLKHNRRKLFGEELSWKFLDPRMKPLARIAARLVADPLLNQDLLFQAIQALFTRILFEESTVTQHVVMMLTLTSWVMEESEPLLEEALLIRFEHFITQLKNDPIHEFPDISTEWSIQSNPTSGELTVSSNLSKETIIHGICTLAFIPHSRHSLDVPAEEQGRHDIFEKRSDTLQIRFSDQQKKVGDYVFFVGPTYAEDTVYKHVGTIGLAYHPCEKTPFFERCVVVLLYSIKQVNALNQPWNQELIAKYISQNFNKTPLPPRFVCEMTCNL